LSRVEGPGVARGQFPRLLSPCRAPTAAHRLSLPHPMHACMKTTPPSLLPSLHHCLPPSLPPSLPGAYWPVPRSICWSQTRRLPCETPTGSAVRQGRGHRARGDKRLSARRKMRPRDVRALERAGHALFRTGRGAGRSPMPPRTEAARPRTRGFRNLVHVGPDGHRQGGKPRHKLHRGRRRVCWDRLTRLAPATDP
jgi:hypothetical protein